MVYDLKSEILLTVEIVIKRPLRHFGCAEDFLKTRVIKSLEMDELCAGVKDLLFGIRFHNPRFSLNVQI